MNKIQLDQYFSSLSKDHISTSDKAMIYRNFLEKRQKIQNKSRVRIYKSIAYSVSTFTVIAFMFFGNFFGIFEGSTHPQEMTPFVVAQTIGKIINHQGNYIIYNKDSRAIAGNSIELTDRIVVDENSKVEILVHESFVAQVYGPAQFEITLNNDQSNYTIQFINGGDDIHVNSVNATQKNISIQTSDGVVIKNHDRGQNIAFSVKKDKNNGQRSIINQSESSLQIKKSNHETENTGILIAGKHSVDFSSNDKDVTILAQEELKNLEITTGSQSLPKSTPPVHIITEDDIKNIKLVLDKAFLQSEYQDLITNYFIGKDNEYSIVINNIKKRLDRIAPIANINLIGATNIQELLIYGDVIVNGFKKYDINEEIYHNLPIMMNKLKELSYYEYGVFGPTAQKKTVDFKFISSLIDFRSDSEHIYY